MKSVANKSAKIEVQYADTFKTEEPPSAKKVIQVLNSVLPPDAEITVRFVSADESKKLNKQYLAKDKPANVLAFPYLENKFIAGDIAICPQVVVKEAKACNVSYEERYVHLLIHAALHLLGLSHDTASNAKIMESRENEIMQNLGYQGPYSAEH